MAHPLQAIVLGGAGDVGEGIVRQLRKPDWSVIAPSRSAEKLAATEAATAGSGRFLPLEAEIGSEEGTKKAADTVRELHGPVDLVVAAVGGWWGVASLLEMATDGWNRVLEGLLSADDVGRKVIDLYKKPPEHGASIVISSTAEL